MTKIATVKTQCCPDAKGRKPLDGEDKFTLKFPLEDGSYLFVEMGQTAFNAIRTMIGQMDADDAKEAGHG